MNVNLILNISTRTMLLNWHRPQFYKEITDMLIYRKGVYCGEVWSGGHPPPLCAAYSWAEGDQGQRRHGLRYRGDVELECCHGEVYPPGSGRLNHPPAQLPSHQYNNCWRNRWVCSCFYQSLFNQEQSILFLIHHLITSIVMKMSH